METCTNCGSSLRPGAKFCTTCGTRLNESHATNSGWGTPRTNAPEDSQETTVMNAVTPAEQAPTINRNQSQTVERWSNAYGDSASDSTSSPNDPASRFISALDDEVQPVRDSDTGDDNPVSTWDTSAPVFTPPPLSNWTYQPGNADTAWESKSEEPDSEWQTPSTWAEVKATKDAEEAPVAEIQEVVTPLSEPDQPASAALSPDDARVKAIALADELRQVIRMMSSGSEPDMGAAAMALTEASLHVSDFSDLRGVITDVKEDPRDIQKLSNLAEKIERFETLLNEHDSLADAIETAIKELAG